MAKNSDKVDLDEEFEPEADAEAQADVLPDSVWDEYHGQHVYIELKVSLFAVSNLCGFAKVSESEFLRVPLLAGILRVKKDKRGEIRLTVQSKDPAENCHDFVRTDFSPDIVQNVTVTMKQSRIVGV